MPVTLQFILIALPLMGVAYLIGSIPFGLLLTKAAGLGDVRAIGSGNIGATNVLRTGNKKLAAATLLLDALKGTLAVLILSPLPRTFGLVNLPTPVLGQALFDVNSPNDQLFVMLYTNLPPLLAAAVLLGHIYPLWLKFKGGKGVATYIGALAAVSPLIALFFAATWLGVFKATRISSLSALTACFIASIAALVAAVVQDGGNGWTPTMARALFIIAGAAMLFYTHRANIARLKAGTEPRFSKPKEETAESSEEQTA